MNQYWVKSLKQICEIHFDYFYQFTSNTNGYTLKLISYSHDNHNGFEWTFAKSPRQAKIR